MAVNIGRGHLVLPKYNFINKVIYHSSTWLPVTQFCIFGLQQLLTSNRMEAKSDSSSGAPPEQGGTGIKRPLEPEMREEYVKRIQLDPVPEEVDSVRRKRRKYALLLSYSGKGYLGMQRNPGFRTIEGDLLDAMKHANLMTDEGLQCPQMFQFQRAARTDKGVSAAKQVVSVKLPDDVPDMVNEVNKHLCDQIRVMAIRRTTKGFNCKTWCDSRTYSYMCPTFAFASLEEITKEDYRITPDVLEKLRSTLKVYKGTHNFHNFTARKKFQEDSAKRYIIDIECGDPFERESIEWVTIRIKGQSFMLHQIRKMVGLAIAVLRGLASPDVISKAWGKDRVDVPIAPSLGLVLEEPHYDKYNLRYGSDGIHEALSWDEASKKIEEFREKYINSTIISTEIQEKSMLKWLETLPLHTYDVREIPGDEVTEAPSNQQSTRSAFGRAKVRLNMSQNSDDEEADEDDGDLDQYRIVPKENEGKVDKKSEASNGDEVGVNGICSKEKTAEKTDTTEITKE
ncbi:pseudouridylate synthase 1 homolog isoform X1 [Palaemon carinicauda]|uniref:pseudouridylate synthase 1 homolog isoform X1 n=2 Tax=Palaemon carinicauda TaxID=392227 RepID=UPI0035B647F3